MTEDTQAQENTELRLDGDTGPEIDTPVHDGLIVQKPQALDYALPIAVMAAILLLDQILKIWVKTHMFLGEERSLIDGWARLHFIENNGIAFGKALPGVAGKLLLTSFRIVAAALIFWYLMKLIRKGVSKGLIYSGALVFAGATGNIIDSIFYGVAFAGKYQTYEGGIFMGQVVDMLYFPLVRGHFPEWMPVVGGHPFEFFREVFNLADSSITIGILMIILFFRKSLKDL